MTLKTRIIPCLDVKDRRVVKGVNFGARAADKFGNQCIVISVDPETSLEKLKVIGK